MPTPTRQRPAPLPHHGPQPRRQPVWPLVVLALLAGLGAGLLVGRATKADPSPPADLASASTSAWLRDQIAAVNSGDAAHIRPFYADNATLTDIGNVYAKPLRGGAHIARTLQTSHSMLGAFLNEPGTTVRRGPFIAYVGSWGDVKAGVVVYELDDHGKILNQWAIHPRQ